MQSIEVSGKSLEEARQIAAAKLGVASDSLEVELLEETKGLFGKKSYRVRASVKGGSKPEKRAEPEKVEAAVAVAAASEETAEEPRSKGRGRRRKAEVETPAVEAVPAPKAEPRAEKADPEEVGENIDAGPEDGDALLGLVQELVDGTGLSISAKLGEIRGRYVTVSFDGKDAAYLIGKHGEVLNALQYLVNIASSGKVAQGVRVVLDGNEYRARREAALTKLALKIAEEVRDRSEEAVLDALPAFERRVVHKALADYDGVVTYSEGEEPNRRVVIAPEEA